MKNYNNFINESFLSNKWKTLQDKVLKDIGINFYFIATFGTTITALFPLFEKLIRTGDFENTITSSDIILLVICALAILFKENTENIKKLKLILQEKGIINLMHSIKDNIQNIFNLFSKISKIFGKTLSGLSDMFAYTAFFVPTIICIMEFLNLYQIGFNEFSNLLIDPKGVAIATSIGIITISTKHLINLIYKKIKRKNKSKKTPSFSNEFVQNFEQKKS
jgi:hypothetical protein